MRRELEDSPDDSQARSSPVDVSVAHVLVFDLLVRRGGPGLRRGPGDREGRRPITTRSSPSRSPGEIVLEAGALELMPDGKLAVGTRRGEIWMIDNASGRRPARGEVHPLRPRPARGARPGLPRRLALRHPARRGVAHQGHRRRRQGRRLRDRQRRLGDQRRLPRIRLRLEVRQGRQPLGRALPDRLVHQREQVPRLGPADHARRQVDPDAAAASARPAASASTPRATSSTPTTRAPGTAPAASSTSSPAASSATPTGNRWYERGRRRSARRPREPKSGSRMVIEAKKIPELVPPAVLFPYPKMGQSASGIDCDPTGGKFGPFEKQLFVGDQTPSTVMRVFLEKCERPLPGRLLPLPPGLRLGHRAGPVRPRRLALRRRHQPRLGLARDQGRSPSSGSSGPARSPSRSTRCTPGPTASS